MVNAFLFMRKVFRFYLYALKAYKFMKYRYLIFVYPLYKIVIEEVRDMYDDLSRENIEKNLIDIGCNHQQINSFFECYDCGDKKNMYYLLRKHRCQLLEDVHKEQRKIDYLDYLVYALKKEEGA